MDKDSTKPSERSAFKLESVHHLLSLTAKQLSELPSGFVSYAVDTLCDTGSADEAYKLLGRALAAGLDMRRPAKLINDLLQRQEFDRATSVLEQWYRGLAQKTQADHIGYANSLHAIGDTAKALSETRQTMELYPRSAPAALQAGRFSLLAEEREAALTCFERAIEISQNQPAWVWRAIQALRHEHVSLFGVELHVPRKIVNGQVLLWLIQGRYEQHERSALLADLRPEDRILELGAGLGFLACCAAQAYPDLPYLAVEANPDLCKVIQTNLDLNGSRARLMSGIAALSDSTAAFHLSKRFVASSAQAKVDTVETIEQNSLDTNRLISEFLPTILIIDIEGYEINIVKHLNLNIFRRIIIELHPKIYSSKDANSLFENIFEHDFYIDIQNCSNNVFVFDKLIG